MSLTSVPGNLIETILRQMEDREVIKDSNTASPWASLPNQLSGLL